MIEIGLLLSIYIQAISITQTGTPEEKLDLAFRLYDIDRNGIIEEHEMVEIIRVINAATVVVSTDSVTITT